jgi:hypothetical protein
MPPKINSIIKILAGLTKGKLGEQPMPPAEPPTALPGSSPVAPQFLPWGWLAAVFLLCLLQGWLLGITSKLMLVVFGLIILIVSRAIAQNRDISLNQTDYTYYRSYPVGNKPEIKIIGAVWATLAGWSGAGILSDFWYGAIAWQVVVAVVATLAISTIIIWIWSMAIAVITQKLVAQKLSAQNSNNLNPYLFWNLTGTSWLGLLIGYLISLGFSEILN